MSKTFSYTWTAAEKERVLAILPKPPIDNQCVTVKNISVIRIMPVSDHGKNGSVPIKDSMTKSFDFIYSESAQTWTVARGVQLNEAVAS